MSGQLCTFTELCCVPLLCFLERPVFLVGELSCSRPPSPLQPAWRLQPSHKDDSGLLSSSTHGSKALSRRRLATQAAAPTLRPTAPSAQTTATRRPSNSASTRPSSLTSSSCGSSSRCTTRRVGRTRRSTRAPFGGTRPTRRLQCARRSTRSPPEASPSPPPSGLRNPGGARRTATSNTILSGASCSGSRKVCEFGLLTCSEQVAGTRRPLAAPTRRIADAA